MLEPLKHFGEFLVLDDIHDIGRFNYPGHPSFIHHWQWGLLLQYVADMGDTAYAMMELLKEEGEPEEPPNSQVNYTIEDYVESHLEEFVGSPQAEALII